jgi:hypothetical protein
MQGGAPMQRSPSRVNGRNYFSLDMIIYALYIMFLINISRL